MSAENDLAIWIKWLGNYQAYEGKFSVPIAWELQRVLINAQSTILDKQSEIDILEAKLRNANRA